MSVSNIRIVADLALSAFFVAVYANHFDNGFHFDLSYTIQRVDLYSTPGIVAGLVIYLCWPAPASAYYYRTTQPFALFRYFETFLIPVRTNTDIDRVPFSSIFQRDAFAGWLSIGGLVAVIALATGRRETRRIAFGLYWFLPPARRTSIFPLVEVHNDHRMFFPLVGLAMSACLAAALAPFRMRVPRVFHKGDSPCAFSFLDYQTSYCGFVLPRCC